MTWKCPHIILGVMLIANTAVVARATSPVVERLKVLPESRLLRTEAGLGAEETEALLAGVTKADAVVQLREAIEHDASLAGNTPARAFALHVLLGFASDRTLKNIHDVDLTNFLVGLLDTEPVAVRLQIIDAIQAFDDAGRSAIASRIATKLDTTDPAELQAITKALHEVAVPIQSIGDTLRPLIIEIGSRPALWDRLQRPFLDPDGHDIVLSDADAEPNAKLLRQWCSAAVFACTTQLRADVEAMLGADSPTRAIVANSLLQSLDIASSAFYRASSEDQLFVLGFVAAQSTGPDAQALMHDWLLLHCPSAALRAPRDPGLSLEVRSALRDLVRQARDLTPAGPARDAVDSQWQALAPMAEP